MRWVNDTLPPRPLPRWLLITIRLSTSSLAGMARTLVAVGTVRLAVMFAAVRAAAPRSRTSIACCASGGGGAGLAGAGRVDETGAGVPLAGAAGAPGAGAACGREGGRRRCLGRRGCPGSARRPRLLRRLWVVVGEEVPPGPVHRAGVCLIALVELVNQPFVGPEIGARRIGSRRCTRRRATAPVRWSGQVRGRLWGISRHGGHPPLPTLDYLSFPHTRLPGGAPELRPCLADRVCPVTRRCGLCRAARAS